MQVNCEHECPECNEHTIAAVESLSMVRLEDSGRAMEMDWVCGRCGSRFGGELCVSIDDLQQGQSDHIVVVDDVDVHVIISDYRQELYGSGCTTRTRPPQ